uniref:Myelin basic protein n=1 Tax=Neogobius melanostomus TaxID=47308 RepID=A0A8C6SLJ0_9GOBI
MASASSKKNPGVLDQIGKIFGGDKKKKSKGSFRAALSPAPQKTSAPKKKGADNAVVSFLRNIVSPSNVHYLEADGQKKKAIERNNLEQIL